MQYKIIGSSSDVLSVEERVLVSGSNSGQAVLHITAIEELGVTQTLVIMVKVGEISEMQLLETTVFVGIWDVVEVISVISFNSDLFFSNHKINIVGEL